MGSEFTDPDSDDRFPDPHSREGDQEKDRVRGRRTVALYEADRAFVGPLPGTLGPGCPL